MKVVALHIWVREKKKDTSRRIVVEPTSQNIQDMKMDIAKVIKSLTKKIDYYYVVVQVRRAGGKLGYRVVVPRQDVAA